MKKLLSAALVLTMILSMTACGEKEKNPDNEAQATEIAVDGDEQPTDEAAEPTETSAEPTDAPAPVAEWNEELYGVRIFDVWDGAMLPESVPQEPTDGVKTICIEHKEKQHDTVSGEYYVGRVSFANKEYERWMIEFDCTEAQFDEFTVGMEANGFQGSLRGNEWGRDSYEYRGNGYYVFITVGDSNVVEYPKNVKLEMTNDDNNPRSEEFQGIKLPEVGIESKPNSEPVGQGWSESELDSDVTVDSEIFLDSFNNGEEMPENWNVDFDYLAVAKEEGQAYVQQLISEGWEIVFEEDKHDEYNDREVYYTLLQRDGIYAAVDVTYNGDNKMSVRFGTDSEHLYY